MRVRCSAIHSCGRGLARQARAPGRARGGRLGTVITAKITGLLTRNLPQQMVNRRPGSNLDTKPFPAGNSNPEPGAREDWVPGCSTDSKWCDSACVQQLPKPGTPPVQCLPASCHPLKVPQLSPFLREERRDSGGKQCTRSLSLWVDSKIEPAFVFVRKYMGVSITDTCGR